MKASSPNERIPLRTKISSGTELGLHTHLVESIKFDCENNGRVWCKFIVDEIPMSLNHQYIHARRGKWITKVLSPEIKTFRAKLKVAMGEEINRWRPTGMTAAVVMMYSPLWITQQSIIRKFDIDNRIKPLFDAIEEATGQVDERFWSFHAFKMLAKRERTVVFLFDLGDVVDYYL